MAAANMLTQRWPAPASECFLGITERRALPGTEPSRPGELAAPTERVALGPLPRAAIGELSRALQVPAELPIIQARARDVERAAPSAATGVRVEVDAGRARVTGAVPRQLASLIAVSDETLPAGDPVVVSFVLVAQDGNVAVESASIHHGEGAHARRERMYAFADSRATNRVLGSLLAGASHHAAPIVARAQETLADLAAFEGGAEPGPGTARVVYRAAQLRRSDTYAIARALGPIYHCGVEPRSPSMVDELRELPIAQAFLAAALGARNLDPALLYAVAADAGMPREVEAWHRGIGGIEIPDRIDGERLLGLSSIADEIAALRQKGYLPAWFASAVRGEPGRPVVVAAGARSALNNALSFVAARLAHARERVVASVGRIAPDRELDERGLVFLTLLQAEAGEVAVQRYLHDRRQGPMLPTADEVRGSAAVARAFTRTAIWEQMQRTGVFERAS